MNESDRNIDIEGKLKIEAESKIMQASLFAQVSEEALRGVNPTRRATFLLESEYQSAFLTKPQEAKFLRRVNSLEVAHLTVKSITDSFGLLGGTIRDKDLAYEALYGEKPKIEHFEIIPLGIGFLFLADEEDLQRAPHNLHKDAGAHLRGGNRKLFNQDADINIRANDIIMESKVIPDLDLKYFGPIIQSDYVTSTNPMLFMHINSVYGYSGHEIKHLIDRLWNYPGNLRLRSETSAVLYELSLIQDTYILTGIPALLDRAKSEVEYAIDREGDDAKGMLDIVKKYGQPKLWSYLLTLDNGWNDSYMKVAKYLSQNKPTNNVDTLGEQATL